ncbi:septal ring lytic transglycosylase RlpA family protein [Aurantimonas sp. Leaf443]|uniref:septal ring lytic transglycosylase RlpA family protein n=1 Tax=Aurantimonas sp. Leaf443 TaxID=1736378 RepID=UPI00070227C1|nr:septal ring lytic transglycosylase RlpA family protein [Aurantimonas sp. Leaf443]KQT82203.1 hypothetical protein ASG48_16335 [Aurantimonas sp. Leaf443]
MTKLRKAALLAVSMTFGVSAFTALGSISAEAQTKSVRSGSASYYGKQFHGRRTANGERFNMNSMTAAHRTLPFGTKVKVTNSVNGRSVVVRINDRGPFHGNRVIDLSRGAAQSIGMISSGVAKVKLDVVS